MFINKVFFWTLFSFYFLVIKVELKEVYDVKADELMESMLHDVYKGYLSKSINIDRNDLSTRTSPKSQTTETILLATKNSLPKEVVQNMTLEKFNLRRRRRAAKKLLEFEINPSPNFQNVEDEMTIQTRRFNKLTRIPRPDSARREYYFDTENGYYIYKDKNKTMSLMQQFIYETHYMLPYMQILRKKYKNNLKYQVGYCFALLRNLKKQQMMIFSTLKNYIDLIMTVYGQLQLYQTLLKLDVDMKDLIKLMYTLDAKRKNKSKSTTTTPYY